MSTAVVEPGGGTSSTENTENTAPTAEGDGSEPSRNPSRQPRRRKAVILGGVCTAAWAAYGQAGYP